MKKDTKNLNDKLKRSEEERLKMKDFEKRCQLLEQTLKSKNPNAVVLTSDLAKGHETDETK